jgi:hypothetical protein
VIVAILIIGDGNDIGRPVCFKSSVTGRATEKASKGVVVDQKGDRLIDEKFGISACPERSVTPADLSA